MTTLPSLLRPISRHDIKGPVIYAGMRDDFRKKIIELKKPRRVLLGDRVAMVFENRHTLMLQIEEMCRVENLTSDAQIQGEIDVYNELMPTDSSLAATLFIELPPDADPYRALKDLVGLDEHVVLHIGSHAVRAAFEAGRSTDDKISAVQYIRFPLSAEAKAALVDPATTLSVEIDHPNYRHRIDNLDALRASLAADYA